MTMRGLAVYAALFSVLFGTQSAQAAGREAKERAAKKACLAGDFTKGVELLADLYLDTNDPNHLFNQGRCFEQNHRYEDAISRFREFLVKAVNPSERDRVDTEKHIATCQSYLGNRGPEVQPAAAAGASVPVPMVVQQPQPAPIASPGLSVSQSPMTDHVGSGLRTAGIVTVSVGGAVLIAGAVLNLKYNSMTSDLEKPNNYDRGTDSTRKDYKTLAWVTYSVGAACVVGGSFLYYLGWSKSKDSPGAVALAPAVAPNTVGVILTGGF